MFRRARFSVKPNVRPNAAGRSSNSGGSSGSVVPAVAAADADGQHGSAPTTWSSAAEDSSMVHPGDASGDLHLSGDSNSSRRNEKTSDISGDGDCRKRAEVFPQRRKRISTMPNLIKPRIISPSTHHTIDLTSKCSQKQGPQSPASGNSLFQKEAPSPEKTDEESSPKSPILPEKKTPVPQVPQFSPFKKSASKEPSACVPAQRSDEALPKNTSSPLKERPTQETLVEEETTQSKSKKRLCSDREKIIKTQKLRKLLKEELKKEKKQQKFKYPVIEKNMPEDRSKMIMRDFIYYLPENNPMKSSLVEEKKTEKTSTVTQAREPEERIVADPEDEDEEEDDEEQGGGGGEDDGSLLVPRVKVAEDGSIILDEESLTVEVLRTKGQCVVEENDPIFERGSTTTYSSFRKSYYTRPWSEKETDMFFLAISMVGTDFSMISQLFPHRARTEIKNKFKREEKVNGWRIDKAFKEKKPFDFSFFTKLLEKVLENERKKKDKDVGGQHQKEKNPNKRNTPRSQKKRKDKFVNGQSIHGQDEHQDGRTSDMEIEVDAETAEKENEESPNILEQAEEQTVIESTVTKKKRKRRKKDSEQETENLLEERTIPPEMVEEERTRKKRKNISANNEMNGTGEVGDELEVPNRIIPDETPIMDKEDSPCCIRLNEEAEKDHSVQESKPGEEDVSSANSEYCVEQHSVSQIPPNENIEGFEKSSEAKNEVAVRGKLDENQNMSSQNRGEEVTETDRPIPEKPTQEGQLQNLESDLTEASEKIEPLASNPLIAEVSSESLVENKAAYVSGFVTEETCNASSDLMKVTQESQKAFVEKIEVRGRRQRPKPNIIKVSGRKEASAQGELNKPRSDGAVEKENEQNDAPIIIITAESTETHCQGLDTESANSKQSTSRESSKQTVLKPAPLARGRFQRPKPNLGRVARRQELPGRRTEAEEKASETVTEKASAAAITEKTVMQTECGDNQLPNKDITEATVYEADTPPCEALEKGKVVIIEKVGAAHPNQSPVKNPIECERDQLRNASLSLDVTKDVVNPSNRDSSLQEEKRENSVEIEHSLESFPSRCKENSENASDREELLHTVKHKLETAEKSTVNITSECSETSNLNEAAKSETLQFSEECPTNAQEEVATNEICSSLQNLPGLKNDASNEISLAPDTQKKELVSKQSSQGENKQSDTRSTPLLRGRFQRPKPNIGRVIGRKERSLEGSEPKITGNRGVQKSEPTKTPSMATQIKCVDKILPDDALEDRPEDSEKVIQKDSLVPSLHLREKSIFQEDKSCTIKPAQLVRGRFQRAKLNVGRTSCKKEVPLSENISAPIVGEVKEMEVIKKDDLHPTLEDEVSVQASPGNLERKEGSESIESSSKRCIVQKKHPSSEKSLVCGLLKNQDDIKRKNLDTLGSDTFDPQEINQSESIKPAHLMIGHLWKLKPNVAQVPKNTEASFERENSTEGETGRDAECDTTSYGSKSGKIAQLMDSSVHLMESASSSESRKEKKCTENIELVSPTRSRHSGKHGSSNQPSENEIQIKKEIPKLLSVQEREVENLKGKQPGRTLKQRNKNYDSKTSSTSECENDHCRKMKHHQKVKPHVSRGRNLKPAPRKKSRIGNSKVNLVTLRASSQEDEEDEDEDEPESEYEVESFLPEEVNKAPVFVPKGLRSPNPVPVHIEETMEELEIYENIADEPCISHDLNLSIQPVIQDDSKLYFSPVGITQEEQKKETGINDGSTEAAMTLLAMRDPVFQLHIDTQEKIQEFFNEDEPNPPASFLYEGNEAQTVAPSANERIPSNNTNNTAPEGNSSTPSDSKDCLEEKTVPDSSKTALLSPHSTNKTITEYHRFSDLEECSQETTRVCSTVSLCKRNKTPRPARYRLPKPKPNLNSGLILPRNASQKSLGLSSGMEEYKEIQNVTDEEMSEKPTEEQKVELNFQMDEQLAKVSTAGKYDLHSESAHPAMQENNMESGNLIKEICEIASELTVPKCSQEAIACLPELPDNLNIKSNIHTLGSAEHQFPTAEVPQTEGNNASISAMTEMSAVSGGVTDFVDAEEEPKFILTLVEISADSVECSSVPAVLPHGSEELLPAPILFTSDNMDSLELTRDESVGSITASVEESAASVKDSTERGLQTASSEQLTDLGLTSWKNLKRSSITLEGSSVSEKIRLTAPIEEHLESTDKGTSLKLQYIPRKAAELQAEEREQPQPSLNIGTVLLGKSASEAGLMSGMLGAGKAETRKEQRLFVDTHSSVQSDQVGNGDVLSKTPLPRSYKRSLGFLPLICKINADEEVAAKENNKSFQKACTLISENTAECPASASEDDNREIQECGSHPSTMLSPSKYESGSCSTVQVFPKLSEEEGSAKEQEKEEPTRISEYFFSDIFMEVDDSELP